MVSVMKAESRAAAHDLLRSSYEEALGRPHHNPVRLQLPQHPLLRLQRIQPDLVADESAASM